MNKKLLLAACLVLPLTVHAADEKKPTAQQEKMTACNKGRFLAQPPIKPR